ncbi:MAG TPA: hypothetical protein VKP58_08160 [Candidatus Acidoferrum sp.]|nr:hypothetical protein [Candidatus Acidoferrum sp.]
MAFSAWDGLSNLSDTVVSDLGAFGVIGQPNVGGHQTTQVVRQTALGLTSSITTSATSPASQTQTYILIGAAILIVIGLFLFLPKTA